MTDARPVAVPARDYELVLVLSGGNALGAFEAGVYQALHDHGLLPDWVIGASIGAINGALIAGSPVESRIETLRAFWRSGSAPSWRADVPWWLSAAETTRRTAAANWTMLAGRSGIFGPLLSSRVPGGADRRAIFETDQLAASLDRLVDFDRLNGPDCRYTATAVDLATGDDVILDSREREIGPHHVRASAALPVAFPPVEIDGRWLVDGGLSANLPLDPLFAAPPTRPTLCVAVDLLPLGQALPRTLGETASRMQDLIFAAQSRRSITRWQAAYAGRTDASVTLVRLPYVEQGREVAGKAMDFSTATVAQRWASGLGAGMSVVERLRAGVLPLGEAGLHVFGA